MTTKDALVDAMLDVKFPGYSFKAEEGDDGSFRIRARYFDTDVDTGRMERQETRWWTINADWTKGQIVQTMFKCILTSKEHFTREHFLYRGRAIFGPHFDIDELHSIVKAPGGGPVDGR